MTYWALNAVFLGAVALVAVVAVLRSRAPRWKALGVAAVVLLATTAVFDNVMIGIGLVDYNPDLISGAFVGIAPLEDFAYAVAAVVLLPSLWHLLGSARPSTGSGTANSSPSTGSGNVNSGPSTGSGNVNSGPSTGSGTGVGSGPSTSSGPSTGSGTGDARA